MGKWIGSRRCWYCGKQLQCKTGGGYHFATIKDPIGNELRVHIGCVDQAVGGGYTTVTQKEQSHVQ